MQTDATLLTNNSQHCWMLHVASVFTPCCTLLDVVECCCAKFETGETFQPTTPIISFVPWSPKRSATMLDPFAQLFQHCWGHACSLHMVYKDLWVVSFPRCTVGPNIVGSCCIRLHTTANMKQQLRTLLSQQCWELLRPFARSLKMTDTVIAFLLLLLLVLWRACIIDLVPGDMEFYFSTCKYEQQDQTKRIWCLFGQQQKKTRYVYYFGGARSKEFATLRNVSKLTFLGQDKAR